MVFLQGFYVIARDQLFSKPHRSTSPEILFCLKSLHYRPPNNYFFFRIERQFQILKCGFGSRTFGKSWACVLLKCIDLNFAKFEEKISLKEDEDNIQ